MPTIHLNKNVFEKLVGKKLPTDKLKDRISMLGTDLDHIEGNEIRVEVFPNRPDMLSEHGFARAFSTFIGTKKGLSQYTVKPSGLSVIVDKSVTMRPYTTCAVVKGLKLNDERIRELMQIQEKLATTHGRQRKRSAYGIYPLEPITFPIKYTALKTKDIKFRPLGAKKEMSGNEILEHHPKATEYKHLTEGWKSYPCFVDANENILSMLPFTNSHDTGKVEESTKDVFIECSGTDLSNVQIALNIICAAMSDMGGHVYSIDVKYGKKTITTPDLTPREMKLDLAYANKMLGLDLSEKQASALLEQMGYGYKKGTVLIPAYRADILHQVDLVEDIAIAYGFENFDDEIPQVSTIAQESPSAIFIRKVNEILVGLGLLETHTYNLSNNEDQNERMLSKHKLVKLSNSVSAEYSCLRASIIPSIMDVLSRNKHREYPQNLYNIGKVFSTGESETGVIETETLAVVLCHEKADYTHVRQVIEYLLRMIGYEASFKSIKDPRFIPGRCASVTVGKKKIGVIGELHPQVITNFKLELPCCAAELNLELLQ